MIIRVKGGAITVDTDPASFPSGPNVSRPAIVIDVYRETRGQNFEEIRVEIDPNHCEALEMALRAARLEVTARSIGP